MLVFVVPLKSARSAGSWERVTALLRRTLRSACAQTSPAFRVVVTCHEVPPIDVADARIEFVPVDFPPPDGSRPERRRDRARKQLHGLRRALVHSPSHVMMLDADDCVSNRLAAHVARHPSAHGWYIRSGYFHRDGMATVHAERWRFHRWCGSSHIVRPELYDAPPGSDDWQFFHTRLAATLRARGTPSRPLPFPGAVYNVSNGENAEDLAPILWPPNPIHRRLRDLIFARPLTDAIRREFGLYPLDGPW